MTYYAYYGKQTRRKKKYNVTGDKKRPLIIVKRICRVCKKEYEKNQKYSLSQWSRNKFCSLKCAGEDKKIRDGLTRQERYRRKKGMLKQYSPEWLERIKVTTKDAMKKPEIKEKLEKKRSPMSKEGKIIRSNAMVGRMPKNMAFGGNGSFPNVQRGEYENSKGTMYFRSKWEANYALYLDFLVNQNQIKDWEYEVDRFVFEAIKFGTRSYLPDFKIHNNNGTFEYHEVKGYMDSRSKTKLKRMAKYYPDIKLLLIDSKVYNEIKNKLGKTIGFY